MQLEGRNIYHLAFGQSPFPIPDCFVKELKNYAHKNDYLPVAGTVHFFSSFLIKSIPTNSNIRAIFFLSRDAMFLVITKLHVGQH